MYMNTNSTTPGEAPMVVILRRRRSPTIDDLLENARVEHPRWSALYEDSRLAVPGEADRDATLELLDTSPSERLRGFIEGLFEAN